MGYSPLAGAYRPFTAEMMTELYGDEAAHVDQWNMRVDQMVTDFVQKAQSTADVVERGIVAPIHEISAVIKGVRAGLEFLVGRRRASRTSDVSQDEQMFI